jgi:hypothetical protein
MPLQTAESSPLASRWFHRLLLLLLVALPLLLYLSPGDLWISRYHGIPDPLTLSALGACVVLTFWLGSCRHRRLCNAAIAAVLGVLYFAVATQPLGDYAIWHEFAGTDSIGFSELLANVIYREVFEIGGTRALSFVAPVFGIVFAFVFLSVCDLLFLHADHVDDGWIKKLCCLSFLAGSWQHLFAWNYIENTQLSLPFLLIAVLSITRYSRTDTPRRHAAFGALWLALAALVHGQNFALMPAIPLIIWLFPSAGRSASQRWIDLLTAVVVTVVTIGAVIGSLLLAGYYLHLGHIHLLLFVPLSPHEAARFTLFAPSHLYFMGNTLLLASPLVVALPLLLLIPGTQAAFRSNHLHPGLVVLALGFCGYAFFVLFALGFPRDYDLILSMGVVVHLCLVQQYMRLSVSAGRILSIIAIALGSILSWGVAASLRPPSPSASHANGPAWSSEVRDADGDLVPVLFANGRTGEIRVRPDERLVVEMRTPPGLDPMPFRVRFVRGVSDDTSRAGTLLREGRTTWVSKALDPLADGDTITLCGSVVTASGTSTRTNAIVVRWR